MADRAAFTVGALAAWLVAALTCGLAMAADPPPDPGPADDGEAIRSTELLRDRGFESGVGFSPKTTYPTERWEECRSRWERALPSTGNASWRFIEIAEKTYFGDNPQTPQVDDAGVTYSSRDRSKRFEIDRERGGIRFVLDTEREWRGGCNLSLPQAGIEPAFSAGKQWNWPHFLVYQNVVDPSAPDEKLWLSAYHELRFSFSAELALSEKGRPDECPAGSWPDPGVRNHCLFYVVFSTAHKDQNARLPDQTRQARWIFALYPVFHSYDGKTHEDCGPWAGVDPAEQAVYWTPVHDGLEVGREQSVTIDALAAARESIAALNQRFDAQLSPDDYYIAEVLVGWEVWGAYRSDIRLRDLSFRGNHYEHHQGAQLQEYHNPDVDDHLYSTQRRPEGLEGYRLTEVIGRIPTVALPNALPLFEYHDTRTGDHYYSTDCLPWGFSDYAHRGGIGYVFSEKPAPEAVELHQYWSPGATDHRCSTEHHPEGFGDYRYEKSLGFIWGPEG